MSRNGVQSAADPQHPKRQWISAFHVSESETETKDKLEKARRLVLCFDGTGNQFSDANSNVLQFFKCLRKDDDSQIVYYQTGIGTYTNPAFVTKPVIEVSMALDAAIGWNIENHIHDAYLFLVQNYKPGDKISLFGFSRGAYTARVLLGFVQKVGLLPRDNHAQIPFAWKVFKSSDDTDGIKKCDEYKEAFSSNVKIDFVGIWDTVASLGISGIELPFARPREDGGIRIFRHAVALDERRAKFTPNFKLTEKGTDSETETPRKETGLARPFREVWFAGCHCDVGGGSVLNTTPHSLARIPLRWMIRECFRMDTGIIFDKEMLFKIGFGQTPAGINISSMMIHEEPYEGRGKSIRARDDERGCSQIIQSLMQPFLALCIPVKHFLLFLYALFAYPFNLVRYSKYSCVRIPLQSLNRVVLRLWGPVKWLLLFFYMLLVSKCFKDRMKKCDLEMGSSDAGAVPRPREQVMEELDDALSPIHDQLSMNRFWWIFEVWPLIFRLQDSKNGTRDKFESRFNLGKGRKIYGDAWNSFRDDNDVKQWYIEVHRSVRTRMEAHGGYRPRAWFTVDKDKPDFHWKGDNLNVILYSEDREMIRWVE